MSKNIEIVKEFYDALGRGDHLTANSYYHKKAHYKDEIFDLKGLEIHALWYRATLPEMDLNVKLGSIWEENDIVYSEWEFAYNLEVINRRIRLNEKGTFKFQGDKIIEHSDEYDFWSWCIQAFGLIGRVLGWSNWLQNRVRKQAAKSVLVHLYSAQGKK